MLSIQQALRNAQPAQAIALLRTSRALLPNQQYFGQADMEPEVEFIELKDIHTSDLREVVVYAHVVCMV